MKAFQCLSALLLFGMAHASELEDIAEMDSEARLFFVNFTSSLVQVNATILAYGLIALAVLGAAAIALYYLFLESQNSSSGYGQGYGQQYSSYQQYARSNDAEPTFNSLNIIKWISMLNDVYEKFDMNDMDCQKKLICEITNEPEYYGSAARSFKTGLQYARYLEVLNLPDELRELLDEYMDADAANECDFKCDYSIKQSFSNNSL